MHASRVGRAALALGVACAVLAGCAPGGEEAEDQPILSDTEVLEQFVDAERELDASHLAVALAAAAELEAQSDAAESEWEAARRRMNAEVGAEGAIAPAFGGPGTSRAAFDFASMAFGAWSFGILLLGSEASGTSERTSSSGDIATTESITVTATKRGAVASVDLTMDRTQTWRQGWSIRQSTRVVIELPLCPDPDGVISFDIDLEMTTTGSVGTGASSAVTDTLAGHTTATVDDDANLATLETTGQFDHVTSAPDGAGDIAIRVTQQPGETAAEATAGDVSDAQLDEARGVGGIMLTLAGGLAVARAGDFYEKGYCTEIVVDPDGSPVKVDPGSTTAFEVVVNHRWDGGRLEDRVSAQLDGAESVDPTARTATPSSLRYVAPDERGQTATIHLESRSRRGIAVKDLSVRTLGGFAIHATDQAYSYDGVSCESPFGPWHIVITGSATQYASHQAYWDVTLDEASATGPVSGEEHSVGFEGLAVYDGSYAGTASLADAGDGYVMKLSIDSQGTLDAGGIRTPVSSHLDRELDVIPATEEECD